MQITALLTGRGNNTMKDKNVRLINGKPLLYYGASAAKKSKYITDFFCSSDDDKILNAAESCGYIPIKRPWEYAQPNSQHVDAIKHALSVMEQKYNLKTISDLKRISRNLTIAPTLEFINREDGLPGLKKEYNLEFKDTIGIDGSPRYTALLNNDAQVIDAFTTDGLLKKFDLVVLEDDKSFFPPYNAIPLVREETLEKYPEIEPILNNLGTYLTDEVMQDLNYQVDELGKSPEKVASDFLNVIDVTSKNKLTK